MAQMNLSTENKITDMENRLVVAKGEGREWDGWGFGVSRCKRFHLEGISPEVLLYSTGNYIQYLRKGQNRR